MEPQKTNRLVAVEQRKWEELSLDAVCLENKHIMDCIVSRCLRPCQFQTTFRGQRINTWWFNYLLEVRWLSRGNVLRWLFWVRSQGEGIHGGRWNVCRSDDPKWVTDPAFLGGHNTGSDHPKPAAPGPPNLWTIEDTGIEKHNFLLKEPQEISVNCMQNCCRVVHSLQRWWMCIF